MIKKQIKETRKEKLAVPLRSLYRGKSSSGVKINGNGIHSLVSVTAIVPASMPCPLKEDGKENNNTAKKVTKKKMKPTSSRVRGRDENSMRRKAFLDGEECICKSFSRSNVLGDSVLINGLCHYVRCVMTKCLVIMISYIQWLF